MEERRWECYLERHGEEGVKNDLRKQFDGQGPSHTFTLWWFEDPDSGPTNFRERVKSLLGKKLFNKITNSSSQKSKHKK